MHGVLIDGGVSLVPELHASDGRLVRTVGTPHQVEDLGMVFFGGTNDDVWILFLEGMGDENVACRLPRLLLWM